MDTAATCKYYVTKLLGIGPAKPNCVYDVRSGNVRDREQKSLFRVFYRSNGGRRRKLHRGGRVAAARESYVPSAPEQHDGTVAAAAAAAGERHVLEEDTVEDIEKKFQGFRNVFEKCKVKKKKPSGPPRLYNVSSGLRFTLVANTMLMDGPKRANETADGAAIQEVDRSAEDGDGGAFDENGGCGAADDEDEDEEDGGCGVHDDVEDCGGGGGSCSVHDNVEDCGGGGDAHEDDDDDDDADAADTGPDGQMTATVAAVTCPKDVADKVNLWIDSSAKQTDEYSEEETVFVDGEVNAY